jgi:WhiB family redox-sensing transcriptional regulator
MQLSWRVQAACGGVDAALFFPEADDDPANEAKAVCAECPVRIACFDHAMGNGEKAGVWGGTTERERRRILRQRRQTA